MKRKQGIIMKFKFQGLGTINQKQICRVESGNMEYQNQGKIVEILFHIRIYSPECEKHAGTYVIILILTI